MEGFHTRPYQEAALEAILQGFASGNQKQLLVMSTGGGKTIVFSKLIQDYVSRGKRCLIMAHREELLEQARDKLYRSQHVIADLERAEHRAALGAQCVVGSIQTLCRPKRLARWPRDHFDLIIVDEAHRTLAPTYMRVIEHFESAHLLGVTATPDRGDQKNLGRVYENVAYQIGLKDLVNQEYLCRIEVKTFPIDLDMSGIHTRAGDYDAGEIGHALQPLLRPIADAFVKEIEDRKKVLVFLPLRSISRDFVDILRSGYGVNAEHIDGESTDRKEILERYSKGEIKVLCNAMLLTEGYDEPSIDTVMCLRPTRSRSLYSQMIGRGTRLHPGKEQLLILDPLWMSETHSLIKPAHLVAETEEEAREITEIIKDPDYLPGIEDESVDLMAAMSDAAESRLEKIKKVLQSKAKIAAKNFDPISYAIDVMDSPVMAEYEPTFAWERAPATDKQLELLQKEGFDPSEIQCKGHASKLLDTIFHRRQMGLATTKQLFHLHQMNVPNANSFTMEEASAELSRRWGTGNYSKPAKRKPAPERDVMAEFANL